MKQILILIGGFILGVLFTRFMINSESDDNIVGLSLERTKGECIKSNGKLKIFQVINPNSALAETGESSSDLMVLLINYEGKSYYDDQKITITSNKCAKQIGTYKYTTNMGIEKTVPAVVIE
jgi:hypothetical protein